MLLRYAYSPASPLLGGAPTSPVSVYTTEDFAVTISPKWYHETIISWPEFEGATYNVYRTEAEGQEGLRLNIVPLESPGFTDREFTIASPNRDVFYQVEVINSDGSVVRSKTATWEGRRTAWAELRANDIQRRELLLLRKFTGIHTKLFKRKSFGTRCPACWSKETERCTNAACPTCYGTGIKGGYYAPIDILVQYDPASKGVQPGYQGRIEPNALSGWTVSFPNISYWDLLGVVKSGKILRVDSVLPTELQSVCVRQVLSLSELTKNSPEYALIR